MITLMFTCLMMAIFLVMQLGYELKRYQEHLDQALLPVLSASAVFSLPKSPQAFQARRAPLHPQSH